MSDRADRAHLTVIQGDITEPPPPPSPSTVATAVLPRQTIGAFIVPQGYEVWADGTYKLIDGAESQEADIDAAIEPGLDRTPTSHRRALLQVVARRPLWIRQFGALIDTDEELVQLAYVDAFGTPGARFEWVTRRQLADRRQLIDLAARGLPIRTGNAQYVENYLDKALHENAPSLPRVAMGTRSGAYHVPLSPDSEDRGWGWLLGKTWIGPAGTTVLPDPRVRSPQARGFALSGSEEQWFAKFRDTVAIGPVARWLCCSIFAAPLLRHIRHRTFIIHHWGDSGHGKSSLLKFGMSAVGDPGLLTATFNRTQLSFGEIFKYVDDLPVGFDELQASTNEDHRKIIYAICLERGRARSGQHGGLEEEIESWRSVARMNGEEPIITNDLGGQANRVLQLNALAMSDAQAGALHQWMDNRHFGWGGFRFIEHLRDLLRDPLAAEKLRERHVMLRDEISARSEGTRSRSSALACVALAQMLISQWFFNANREQAVYGALEDAVHIAGLIAADQDDDISTVDRALQIFRDNRETQRKRWFDVAQLGARSVVSTKAYKELFAIEHAGPDADEVWIVGTEAAKLLKAEQLSVQRTWVDMRRAGVLRTGKVAKGEKRGRLSSTRALGEFRARVYVIKQSAFDCVE